MYKLIFILNILIPFFTNAYIGPGMAGGFIASIVGIILAILIGFVAVLYYPIKRFLKKRKNDFFFY
tara:strand:+ start:90 stop:287 length:198 start_codon:yes stop_codon:yes gene_type:complete